MKRFNRAAVTVAAAGLLFTSRAWAAEVNEEDVLRQLDEMRRRMQDMETRHREQMDALRTELDDTRRAAADADEFESELDAVIDRMDTLEADSHRYLGRRDRSYLNISLNALMAAGTATEDDDVISQLEGGGHDPSGRGFTLQNLELSLSGGIDPYFTGQANIVHRIDSEGETQTELEEAYAETTSLPHGLKVKAGHYYTALGRHNPEHPHAWEFVDAPVMNTRFLGPDGMRGTGAQISWLAPTATPIEITFGVQNADGETMTSFIGVPDEEEGDGHGHGGGENSIVGELRESLVHSLDDLVYSARGTVAFESGDEHTTLLGISGAFGPNASGGDTDTTFVGADVTHRWKPLDADRGFPFVETRIEALFRRFEFDSYEDEHDGEFVPSGHLEDRGISAHVVWGFEPGWTAAIRYDMVDADLDADEPGLDDRDRISVALTHYFSEFSKLRLQVNHDDADSLDDDVTSFWLQLEFSLGSHAAHQF